jgi:predicted TIM-barrel fold metal-dependent hydrolase
MYRIDADHHLWCYNTSDYDWLDGDIAMPRHDSPPEDLLHATRQAGVSGTAARTYCIEALTPKLQVPMMGVSA